MRASADGCGVDVRCCPATYFEQKDGNIVEAGMKGIWGERTIRGERRVHAQHSTVFRANKDLLITPNIHDSKLTLETFKKALATHLTVAAQANLF